MNLTRASANPCDMREMENGKFNLNKLQHKETFSFSFAETYWANIYFGSRVPAKLILQLVRYVSSE